MCEEFEGIDDICANCGEDCSYSEDLIWVTTDAEDNYGNRIVLSFCDDECFQEWTERQVNKSKK